MNFSTKKYLFITILIVFSFVLYFSMHKTTPTQDQLPNTLLFRQRAFPTGAINSKAYKKALNWKKLNKNKSINSTLWEFIGPTNIGGRITDIEIPSEAANTYYVGAASGGVFKTIDAGENWTPIFDEQSMLSIGDIEISKTDNSLIYVGTGETNAGGGSLAFDGNGIYKSENAGVTWENKGLNDVGSISKVLINPLDNAVLYAGAMGPLFRKDENRGVYRSLNSGASWEKVLYVSDSTGIIDMAINPVATNIVYAASWERIRRPNYRSYGGETSRIYRTTDAGDTWDELTNGLPDNPENKGRISIDISHSNPNILYASYTDKIGNIEGVYKTTDGGDSWLEVDSGFYDTSYHWWFGGIYIDPTNPQNLFHAGFYAARSTDGATSWSNNYSPHVDQHAFAFNTQNPNEVLLGNDGGLYKSTNNGASYSKLNNLPITQFYRFTVDEQNENKRYGGAQDNNTIRTTTGSNDDWNAIYGGDGFQPIVDPTNTNTIYALYQRGNLARSTNDAASFTPKLNGINSADRNNWDTPICIDPEDSNILYYGTHRLYKTINKGDYWNAISADLTNGDPGGNLAFGTLTSIAVSPLDSNVIYVGTDDSNVWVTEDAGSNWTKISNDLPTHWVTKVKASPYDVNTLYVTFSGYRYGDDDGQLFVSTDKGGTWSNLSENLPDVPINDIEIDTFGNLFVATDIGVLASNDEGETWAVFSENFPAVVVTDLYYHNASDFLYAATYGRSSYRVDLSLNTLSNTELDREFNFNIYPNPAKEFINIQVSNSNINQWNVKLIDLQGKLVKEYNSLQISNKKILKIDVSEINKGVYLLKIGNGTYSKTQKVILVN